MHLTPKSRAVDLNRVRRKHDERSADESSPSLIEGWRNPREQGYTSLNRHLERAHEAITGRFELSELAQKNKIGPCFNLTPHRLDGGRGSSSIKVAHGRAGT
jgi:hypothetical protein